MPSFITCALVVTSLLAQGGPPGGQRGRGQETSGNEVRLPNIMAPVTTATINLASGPLTYTAHPTTVALKDEAGEVECQMFCVNYFKQGADPTSRPVTFAFNGGPGSASFWLHMGALGPKRAPMNDDGSLPKPPYMVVDNKETWLDFTDVVMVDAPGTGFSRIARRDLASKYFGVTQDIAAFTTFVRNWLTANHRWNSPIFIAGESYGGIRGSGLSASLFRSGIPVCGFISISGTSNFMTLDGMRGNDLTYLSFLPSMAACAWYHHKLSPRFKSVESVVAETEKWIDTEYAAALQKGDSLTDKEKSHIADKLSEYLSLSKKYCLGLNLRVPERLFFRELLRDDALTIGRYDGRLTGKEELAVGERGSGGDPSDNATTMPFTTAVNSYLLDDLKVGTDLPYLNSGNVRPWSEPEGSYSETASDLRTVLARDPHFKVLYCCGYYDLACPLYGTVYTVNHMGLDPDARSRVSFQYYPAGHMMYIEKSSREKLHEDVKRFIADCLR